MQLHLYLTEAGPRPSWMCCCTSTYLRLQLVTRVCCRASAGACLESTELNWPECSEWFFWQQARIHHSIRMMNFWQQAKQCKQLSLLKRVFHQNVRQFWVRCALLIHACMQVTAGAVKSWAR